MWNDGRNQAGPHCPKKMKGEKNGHCGNFKGLSTNTGADCFCAAQRGSSGINTWRSQRDRVCSGNKPTSTSGALRARCRLSFRQGSWAGVPVTWSEKRDGVTLILRCCSLRGGRGTYPVQVPHAALFLVILLQGVIAMKLPETHTQRKRTQQYSS